MSGMDYIKVGQTLMMIMKDVQGAAKQDLRPRFI